MASSLTTSPSGASGVGSTSKSSTARTPTTPSPAAMLSARLVAAAARLGGEVRGRRDHFDADAVPLHRLDHRPCRRLPERRAGHHRGELAADRHVGLDDGRDAGGQFRQVGRVADHPHPTTVISAGRASSPRSASRARPRTPRRRRARSAAGTVTNAGPGKPAAPRRWPHRCLVLGELQRVGRWMDRDALRGQRANVAARDVLVIEGQHVAGGRERAQRVEIGRGTDFDVRGDERGPVIGALGEDAQRLAQGDRRLVGHAGELAATDHADDGQPGPLIHDRRA